MMMMMMLSETVGFMTSLKKVKCVVHVYQILYVWFWSSATTP